MIKAFILVEKVSSIISNALVDTLNLPHAQTLENTVALEIADESLVRIVERHRIVEKKLWGPDVNIGLPSHYFTPKLDEDW